jgi:hypothetical protein
LYGGIVLTNAGDTVRVINNRITGAGPAIDISFQPGATTFILSGNNITSDGGVHIGKAARANQILSNEIETFPTFKGSRRAVIDIEGAPAPNYASGVMIQNNSLQVVNNITADGILVDYAHRTLIVGNRFRRGAGDSKDIVVTANALNTFIGTNIWLSGEPFSSMVSDSSASTVLALEVFNLFDNAFLLGNNLNGRGNFFLAAEAACLSSGASDRFLKWSPGTSQTCNEVCAAVACGRAATCVKRVVT